MPCLCSHPVLVWHLRGLKRRNKHDSYPYFSVYTIIIMIIMEVDMCVHACCFSLSTYGLFVCLHAGWKGWARVCRRSRWIHDVRPGWSNRTQRSQGYIYLRDPHHFPHILSLTMDVWCMSSQYKRLECKCIFVCREIMVDLDPLEFQWVFWKTFHFYNTTVSPAMDEGAINAFKTYGQSLCFVPDRGLRDHQDPKESWVFLEDL